MTANEFNALCNELTIAPAIALENENVRQALRDQDDEEVKRVLETEF